MAETNKDFMTRLADRGEQVVGRITDLPGAKTLVDSVGSLTKRLDTLEGKGSPVKRTTTRKKTATTAKVAPKRPPTTRRKPPSSP